LEEQNLLKSVFVSNEMLNEMKMEKKECIIFKLDYKDTTQLRDISYSF